MMRLPILAALGLLASQAIAAKPPHLVGSWGGPHVGLSFQGGLGDVRFDCASGTIDAPVYPSKNGAFEARGTYRPGTPGPVRVGQIFTSQPATYSGTVSKKGAMTLNIMLENGSVIGPFALVRGAVPQLNRCL